MLWDIFCKVIDNHGDIGVCWRLAVALARRGEAVRLRVDDASALAWMAPQGAPGVQVLAFDDAATPGDVAIEAFGCELPAPFQAALAVATHGRGTQPTWVNLEYLTAEAFARRNHLLASPVLAGPAAGLEKRFFYPGFTAATGGLLREDDLLARQESFDAHDWLASKGVHRSNERLVSLFCYEPAPLAQLLDHLASDSPPTRLLVTAGRAASAVRAVMDGTERGSLSITWLPLLPQHDFDHLLWSCDLNFVRGEDSLVRALWAGRAFAWELYPQDDDAHLAKLAAFLGWLDAPAGLASLYRAWNGDGATLPSLDLPGWGACARIAREELLNQQDLASQLMSLAGAGGKKLK